MSNQEEIDHDAIIRRQSVIRSESIDILSGSTSIPSAEKNLLVREAPFYKFVLTGGPCGGKTTALARLSSYLRERGFEVFTVPEAFTICVNNGFDFNYFGVDGMGNCMQATVMDIQISLEDSFERILRATGKPSVMLCDRGLMDGKAYMSSDEWDTFLKSRVLEAAEIREGRYNAVFHLVTAAEGAEPFYSLENNEARTETPEQAREQDGKTREAWVGHPQQIVIDNSTDFEGKLMRLVSAASKLVGLPTTMKNVTMKYLLRGIDLPSFPNDVAYTIFDVDKVYLYDIEDGAKDSNNNYVEEYSFIRKRSHVTLSGDLLGSTYGLTTVRITKDGKQVEVKRIISAREYASAFKARDTTRHIVKQKRITFLWKMQSFTVHIFKEPINNLCILYAQTGERTTKDEDEGSEPKVDMPYFLDVERKINNTKEDNDTYGAFSISRI